MSAALTVDAFLTRAATTPVIDVRTPAEFAAGHIPGAINVPLFSNDERARVGTAYRQHGRQQAVTLGLEIVGPRLAALAQGLLERAPARRLLLHCWRGGMRSGSVAWLMESQFGCEVATLGGGYKAFRRWVMQAFDEPRQMHVVAGLTGSGKTRILHELAACGCATIDLEALAHHKGSAFGQLGEAPQPTQVQFENLLATAWRATDPARPVWLEDESRMIGKRIIPAGLWARKQHAFYHVVHVPDDERIRHLCEVYGRFPAADIKAAIDVIHSRLGGNRHHQILAALEAGDLPGACRGLLTYYDRAYQKSLATLTPDRIRHNHFPTLNPAAIAQGIVS